MNKQEFMNKYDDVKDIIDKLYAYNCLTSSGFNKDTAYDLISTLIEVWLKCELDTSISQLSDYLYFMVTDEGYDIKSMTPREILSNIDWGVM